MSSVNLSNIAFDLSGDVDYDLTKYSGGGTNNQPWGEPAFGGISFDELSGLSFDEVDGLSYDLDASGISDHFDMCFSHLTDYSSDASLAAIPDVSFMDNCSMDVQQIPFEW